MKAGYRHIPPSWYKGGGGWGVEGKCKEVSSIKKPPMFVTSSRTPLLGDQFFIISISEK